MEGHLCLEVVHERVPPLSLSQGRGHGLLGVVEPAGQILTQDILNLRTNTAEDTHSQHDHTHNTSSIHNICIYLQPQTMHRLIQLGLAQEVSGLLDSAETCTYIPLICCTTTYIGQNGEWVLLWSSTTCHMINKSLAA